MPCLVPMSKIAGRLSVQEEARRNSVVAAGVNLYRGRCAYHGVAEAFGLEYCLLEECIDSTNRTGRISNTYAAAESFLLLKNYRKMV